MRDKGIWKTLAILAVLVMVGSCGTMPSVGDMSESDRNSSSATIYVPDEYSTIQEAVNAASPRDTIIVREGTYIENIKVDKRLTIRSENGSASTIVRAGDPDDHVFKVTANYVNISGFTVEGASSKAGISLKADYCNISSNNCSNNRYGIALRYSNNNKLTGNIMLENGIDIWGDYLSDYKHEIDESNTVNGKTVYYWKDVEGGRIPDGAGQVILVNCKNVMVENQNINNASDGIDVAFSSYIYIKNNNCSDNLCGISLSYSNHNSISNNNCSNSLNGINLFGSNNDIISNNICLYNEAGISLGYSNNTSISNNICLYNEYSGIDLRYSNNTAISNNICSSNKWDGIDLFESNNNNISSNKCSSNNDNGIRLQDSKSNNISNNICLNNGDGIFLLYSNNTSISDNKCSSNNEAGISLWDSNNNIVSNNNCSNNDDGIELWGSNNNRIYLNNFINNDDNINSRGTNIWNSKEMITYTYIETTYTNYLGNYCDDYTGNDADGDGIGDTPYRIDGDRDRYPLMEPWENYTPTLAPTVIYVPDDYAAIQAAVNAASPGDTIIVRDGTYIENINVDKSLTIRSENGPDLTIVGAEDPNNHVFNVTADYVNISGFTVKGADTGIHLYNVDYCNISNNICSFNDVYGIDLLQSNNNCISNNICSNNDDYGLSLWWYSNNNSIFNNTCSNNDFGIYLYNSGNNLIKSNNVLNNRRITAFVGTVTTEEVQDGMVRRHITTGLTSVISANGISLFNSSKNEIYLNNFINNTIYSFNSTNIWSSPSEIPYSYNGSTYTNYLGNYWDDYKEKYPDADEINECGIWDTPYDINSDKDNYPLTKRFENYSIIPPATTVSDGYVELTLNKMERTDTVPPEFIRSPLERARPPEEGHDFVVINLTLTRIEGRYVLFGHSSILFDDKGDDYTFNYTLVQGVTLRTETGEPANFSDPNVKYYEANEGSKWLFLSEMPKDREPVRLRFIYSFTESWEKVSIKEGQIEMIFP